MTPAEQVEAGCARQLAEAETMIGNLRNGRTVDAGQIKALNEIVKRLGDAGVRLTDERDTLARQLEVARGALQGIVDAKPDDPDSENAGWWLAAEMDRIAKRALATLGASPGASPAENLFVVGKHPTCPECKSIVIPPGRCVNCQYRGPGAFLPVKTSAVPGDAAMAAPSSVQKAPPDPLQPRAGRGAEEPAFSTAEGKCRSCGGTKRVTTGSGSHGGGPIITQSCPTCATCPTCGGSGTEMVYFGPLGSWAASQKCPTCGGTWRSPTEGGR